MRVFRDTEDVWDKDVFTFALGAAGGLALGILVSRTAPPPRPLGGEFRERARTFARRLRPARLRRLAEDQEILDHLEDAVLRAFLRDEILMERGVDIGAISEGIVELSGSVWSEKEAKRAVALANSIPGVRTVINRLGIDEVGRRGSSNQSLVSDRFGETFRHTEGRTGGMGSRRQSFDTDPARNDDSQHQRTDALAAADRDQFEEEGFTHRTSRINERPEVQSASGRTNYDEDELDNQDPHGKHTDRTLDSPPQRLNSEARVGEGVKPGIRRNLEDADMTVDGPTPRDNES